MITKSIENITQLKIEYSRLQELRAQQEEELLNDMKEVKNNLTPLNLISNVLFAKKKPMGLLVNGLMFGLSFLTGRTLLKKAVGFPASIVASLIQPIVVSLISSKSGVIFERIKNLFKSKKSNPSQLDVMREDDIMFI